MLDWIKGFIDAIAVTMPTDTATADYVLAIITAGLTLIGMIGTAIATIAAALWAFARYRDQRKIETENLASVWNKLVSERAAVAALKEQKIALEEKLAAAERGSEQAKLLERLLARTNDLLRDSRRAHKLALKRVGSLEKLIKRLAAVLDDDKIATRLKSFLRPGAGAMSTRFSRNC